MSLLAGQAAVITGGGRGIGQAVAYAFAQAGAAVVVTARSSNEIEATAGHIVSRGGRALALAGDAGDEATSERVMRAAIDAFGRCDILVCAAGMNGPVGAVADIELDEWEQVIRANLTGTFLFCRAAVRAMKPQGGGKILNVASGLVRRVQPGLAAYSATKAAITHFSAVLAEEVRADGIQVNAIHPGIVKTALMQDLMSQERVGAKAQVVDRMRGLEDSGQLITPEESAHLFLFMVSPAASDLTGRFIAAADPYIAERLGRFSDGYAGKPSRNREKS